MINSLDNLKDSTQLFNLENQVALVTGGSKGLGFAMALGLAGAGANVAITSRNFDEAKVAANEIEKLTDRKILPISADATDQSQIQNSVSETLSLFETINILVNNAGINIRAPILDLQDDEWDAVIATNLTAPMQYCRTVGQVMIKQNYGRIINIGSTLSHISIEDRVPYASSKGGIVQLTRTIALEWAQTGITVNTICPGPFETPINEVLLRDPTKRSEMQAKVPMGRWGKPDELVTTVLYFASKASSFTTGATLFVDGGYTSQ